MKYSSDEIDFLTKLALSRDGYIFEGIIQKLIDELKMPTQFMGKEGTEFEVEVKSNYKAGEILEKELLKKTSSLKSIPDLREGKNKLPSFV